MTSHPARRRDRRPLDDPGRRCSARSPASVAPSTASSSSDASRPSSTTGSGCPRAVAAAVADGRRRRRRGARRRSGSPPERNPDEDDHPTVACGARRLHGRPRSSVPCRTSPGTSRSARCKAAERGPLRHRPRALRGVDRRDVEPAPDPLARPTGSRGSSTSRCRRGGRVDLDVPPKAELSLPVGRCRRATAGGPRAATADRRPAVPDDRRRLTDMRAAGRDGRYVVRGDDHVPRRDPARTRTR